MQTFLPYPSFTKSALALDRQRLGKQRVECKQIYGSCRGLLPGWANHPAVLMWKKYEIALCSYAIACCLEWKRRGYKDNLLDYFKEKVQTLYIFGDRTEPPPWLGDPDFHASHRSNLLRKDPLYYEQHGWTEPNDLPYVWPVKKETMKWLT